MAKALCNSISADGKAILMLCGVFSGAGAADTKPLSLKEYNLLASKLRDKNLRPGDLLKEECLSSLENLLHGTLDINRLAVLLGRGSTLAFSLESWLNKGLWVVCRSDSQYPQRFKKHLVENSPPFIYGIGDISLLSKGGMAIVGSRNVDSSGEIYTRELASFCGESGVNVISGGAKGVDETAMLTSVQAGGTSVGVLADGLLKASFSSKFRDAIINGNLTLCSPYNPDAHFNVGNAMGRNKLVYSLSDYAAIISSDFKKGGTWAGATEELKRKSPVPVFVRNEGEVPEGNIELIKLGAAAFPVRPWRLPFADLVKARPQSAAKPPSVKHQADLFSNPFEESRVAEPEKAHKYNPSGPIDTSQPNEIFNAVLPVLLNNLSTWTLPGDLAKSLNIKKPQLDAWLKVALEKGVIEKGKKPVHYRRKA